MKIYFLGTCHGHQEKGRYMTSMVLEVNDKMYLIDAGAPFVYILKNMGIVAKEKIEAAFITHMHFDHAMSIIHCVFDVKNELYLPEESDVEAMKKLVWFFHSEQEYEHCHHSEFKSVKEGTFFDDGNIKVTAIPTMHMVRGKSFAYMVEGEGKRILFTGDLTYSFADYPKETTEYDFDAIVCELTHFSIEYAIPKFNETRTKKILFNHVRDDKIELLTQNKDKMKIDYYIANDGDIIEI